MTIPFACSCGKSFQAKDEFAGKRTKCPACGQILVIPAGQPAPASTLPKEAPPPEAAAMTATDPGKWEKASDETSLDGQPRPKKQPARPRSRALGIVVGVVVVLIVGAGGGLGYWFYNQNREAGKPIDRSARVVAKSTQSPSGDDLDNTADKVDLGADLNLVPKDAMGFVAVRVADWAASPLNQQIRKQPLARLLLPDPDKEMERMTGLKLADIERATLVLPALNVKVNWTVVFTRKPYDQAKILQQLAPSAEKKLKDKTYHYSEARKMAVYFLSDRLLIAGPEEGIQLFLTPQVPDSKKMIAPLKLAATGQHQVTAALHVPSIILNALPIPPELESCRPILNTSGLTLTLDAADGLQLDAKLDYGDEASATKAETAANGLVKWGRKQLVEFKKKLGQGLDDPAMQPTFKLLDSWTRNIPVSRHGKTVEVRWQIEAKSIASAPAVLFPALQRAQVAASRRTKISNNLKQLMLAMHSYHDEHGHFPPAVVTSPDGRPLYSWRVELLPFLEQDALYQEFKKDEPWDSPHNRKLLAKMPSIFALEGVPTKEPGTTFFQVLVGPGTPFGGKKPPRVPESFPAGTSDTLLIATAAEAVPWTKPTDLVYDPKGPLPKLGRPFGEGTPVAFADGSILFLEPKISDQKLRALIAPPGSSAK